jgi:hypothetical protein
MHAHVSFHLYCGLVGGYQRFERTYCLYLQDTVYHEDDEVFLQNNGTHFIVVW